MRPSEATSRPSSSNRARIRNWKVDLAPRRAVRLVSAADVLDHGLRVAGRLPVVGELPHRRRALQPLGAGAELIEDLFARIALPDPRLEACERIWIDVGQRPRGRLPNHA